MLTMRLPPFVSIHGLVRTARQKSAQAGEKKARMRRTFYIPAAETWPVSAVPTPMLIGLRYW
jgi:hypothetical protein